MSRERNYARNGTGNKSKRETKEEMDGQCGRMVGIIKRKVAASSGVTRGVRGVRTAPGVTIVGVTPK